MRCEVECRGVERVVRGEMERSNLVEELQEALKCGRRSNSVVVS